MQRGSCAGEHRRPQALQVLRRQFVAGEKGRNTAAPGAEGELPVGQGTYARQDHSDVVGRHASTLQTEPSYLSQTLEVFRRVPDRDSRLPVPVHGLVDRVDDALRQLWLPPPQH